MTDIDTIRTITADPPVYDRATSMGDGTQVEFLLPNVPVVSGSANVYFDGVLQAPAGYTLELATGRLVFIAAPGAGVEVVATYNHTLLSDTDIQTFLDLNTANIRLAAADALDTIASSEALVQKKITHLDLQTDGPAVARALREHAKMLRQLATDEDFADQEGLIDYAEMAIPVFAERDIWYRAWVEAAE